MRKSILILLIGVVWFQVGAGFALADGMFLPQPETLGAEYLVVRYHHVTIRIRDGHAVTRVEQEFYNPHDVPITGRYLFPIPPEAILSGFQATVDGQRQEVDRQDAAATNQELYATVVQQRDPSLLQYADWESFAFDLRLSALGSRRMSLEYEEVLAPIGGLYRYRYVLSTERYSSLPVEEVSVTAEIRCSSGLASLYSPSHSIHTVWLGEGQARVAWEAHDANPSEDWELFYAPATGGYGGGLLRGERNGQDHLLFVFSPEDEAEQAEALPKDIVFVIDRSGSMGGEKLEQAQDALHHILGQLGEADRFSIVSFDEQLEHLDSRLVPVDGHTLQVARRFVDDLTADGSTDLEAGLQAGLGILERSGNQGATRMVVFLTDGLPTAGITGAQEITDRVARTNARLEARLHVFGVGYDVNSHLLDRLAAENGGTVTYVQPGENLEMVLTEFYGRIARPLLTDLEIEFQGMQVEQLYPSTLPDLFAGSSLLLAGRYRDAGDEATVRVRGWAGDERREYVYRFDLQELRNHDFVPRLWATRRLGSLLDRVRVDGESEGLVEEIRGLGLSYGIVTPYTTFVIEGQADGAASADNMALYSRAGLNAVSGETTIQARIQNQAYQQASQANLALGANVVNIGPRSFAQVDGQQVDLSLLEAYDGLNLDEQLTATWIANHVKPDRTVVFGSDQYRALAEDPQLRPFLQSGSNVIFVHQGQVIAVRDAGDQGVLSAGEEVGAVDSFDGPDDSAEVSASPGLVASMEAAALQILARLTPFAVAGGLLGLALVAAGIGFGVGLRLR